jgi:uroporphyrin-III C-methyltransferase
MNITKPKLTLVGAGPGDVDLITLKGIKAIKSADYILYDALVNVELLEYMKPTATKIYVGKRSSKHTYSQSEINEMILLFAGESNHVVRLKGGDPYIFGRGYEEKLYAEKHGVQVMIIPGITSATSVPAIAGVPVTMRGVSQSFWVLTATTKTGELSDDIELASQSSATIIVLMGVKKLPEIVDLFKCSGKGDTPVVIIQNGSLPNEKKAYGTVDSIVSEANRTKIGAPSIIVIGEVAKYGKLTVEASKKVKEFTFSEAIHA